MAVPWEDRLFYAEIAGGPAAAGVGPFMIWDWHHPYIGTGLILLGLAAFAIALFPGDRAERADLNRRRFIVLVALMVFVWASVAYAVYDRHRHISAKPIIIGWGLVQPNTCGAQIDGSALVNWGSDYRVAIICGIVDPALDKLDDTRITVTRFFTIPDAQTLITGSFSQAMTDGINNLVAQTIKGQPIPAPGTKLAVQWDQWVAVVVIPATVEPTDIHRLSDVSRLGGDIVEARQFAATTIPPR